MKEYKDIDGNPFIVGKWYVSTDHFYIGKFDCIKQDYFCGEYYYGHGANKSNVLGSLMTNYKYTLPATPEQIQDYLPDDHKLKIKEIKVKDMKDTLKVGTWYFHGILDNNKPSYLGKFLRIDDQNQFQASECTFSSGSSYHTDFIKNRWTTCLWKDNLREATQIELNRYLPEGHKDRDDNTPKSKFKVGDIVDLNKAIQWCSGPHDRTSTIKYLRTENHCTRSGNKLIIKKAEYNKYNKSWWYQFGEGENWTLEGPEITLHQEEFYPVGLHVSPLPELTEDNIRDYHSYEIEFEYLTKYTGKLSIEQGRIFLLENENGHNNGHKLFRDEYKYSVVLDISNSNIKQHKIKLIKFDKFIPSYYTPIPELYSAIKDEEIRLHKVPNSNIQIRTINIPTVEIQRVDLKQQNQLRIQIPEVKPQSIQRVIINNKHLKLN